MANAAPVLNDLDALLAGLNIGPSGAGADDKSNTGAKKGNNPDPKASDKKQKLPIQTAYEGFTLQPLTPTGGEKRTWAKVSKNSLPFDSVKLYEIATNHRQKTGKDAPAQFRGLSANQKGVIGRILDEKQLNEVDVNAVWELYDVRSVFKDVSKGMFRVERVVSQIEVIVCRKDRQKGQLIDKPSRTTTNPQRTEGEIIDLTIPLTAKAKKVVEKENKKNAPKPPKLSADDILNLFGEGEPTTKAAPHDKQPHPRQHDPHDYRDQQLPPGVDLNRHFWNGEFWEERDQPLPYPHQQPYWDQQWQHDPRFAQQQPDPHFVQQQNNAYYHHQQHPSVPPPAPMPMQDRNPFQPLGTHPEQYVDLPTNMDPRVQPNNAQHAGAETRTRSRSRSLHRRQSRRRSRHRYSPSMSSSEADYFSDFTPPSTPPSEEFISAGSLHRRRGQRYYREKRTRYPDERYELQPATTRRIEYVEDYRPLTPRRTRPILIHDDYPRAGRRITNFAEAHEEADFHRPRYREHEMDPLRVDTRRGRHEETRLHSRRTTGF